MCSEKERRFLRNGPINPGRSPQDSRGPLDSGRSENYGIPDTRIGEGPADFVAELRESYSSARSRIHGAGKSALELVSTTQMPTCGESRSSRPQSGLPDAGRPARDFLAPSRSDCRELLLPVFLPIFERSLIFRDQSAFSCTRHATCVFTTTYEELISSTSLVPRAYWPRKLPSAKCSQRLRDVRRYATYDLDCGPLPVRPVLLESGPGWSSRRAGISPGPGSRPGTRWARLRVGLRHPGRAPRAYP